MTGEKVVTAAWENLQELLKDVWGRFKPEEIENLSDASKVSVEVVVEAAQGQDVTNQVRGLEAIGLEYAWMGKTRLVRALRDSALKAVFDVGRAAF